MSGTQPSLAFGRPLGQQRRAWRRGLQGSEFAWAVAFITPYVAIFLAFVVYPVAYGLWLGSRPSLFSELAADPIYFNTVVNTVLYVGLAVNATMFLAFLLSGFFMRKRWWVKGLLVIYLLPWAMPAVPAFLSIHWLLNGQWGLLDNLLWRLIGIQGPIWLNSRRLGLASNIVSCIWKWMPFWTVIFLVGRIAIPQSLYEAAEMDGATSYRRLVNITLPLLANLYLVCTLLSTIWTLGDFNTVYFVSGGAPAMSTDVLTTYGIREAFTVARPHLGIAAVVSALPVLVPIVIFLMYKLHARELQR